MPPSESVHALRYFPCPDSLFLGQSIEPTRRAVLDTTGGDDVPTSSPAAADDAVDKMYVPISVVIQCLTFGCLCLVPHQGVAPLKRPRPPYLPLTRLSLT